MRWSGAAPRATSPSRRTESRFRKRRRPVGCKPIVDDGDDRRGDATAGAGERRAAAAGARPFGSTTTVVARSTAATRTGAGIGIRYRFDAVFCLRRMRRLTRLAPTRDACRYPAHASASAVAAESEDGRAWSDETTARPTLAALKSSPRTSPRLR